ncbi:hypothetical protein N656DRAFT_778197 [Canariomyces notabilis]|uniref:Uncharacterized protein n=1 Tax=Canariomyces notabilis TaxID=2074819 RepID=A0AAN6TFI0_9PEZI|nr:hypothetical protein N656DRAFT_778197 [Canariomyces arenarius]
MPRDEQYTKNKSDQYVDGLAEEGLEEGNPFQQNAADDQLILDPNEAAVAAVMSRDENAATASKGSTNDMKRDDAQFRHLNQPKTTNIFLRQNSAESSMTTEPDDTDVERGGSPERRGSSAKHPRSIVDDATGDASNESDPEVRRLVKRARGDDGRAVIIQPDDDVEEQDRKMQANFDVRNPGYDHDHEIDENEPRQTAEEDFDRPTEVAPMPLVDKISEHRDHDPVPRDADDQDDDIETKRDDDYDVENYAEFEDDDDDMEGPARDTVGNEELLIDEDELNG